MIYYPQRRKPITGEMQAMALRCGTSKADGHSYMPIYEHFMAPLRDVPLRLLEIGVYRGESIRLWLEWFRHPDTKIFGIDAEEFKGFTDPRAIFIGCDQTSPQMKEWFSPNTLDIIIDDACHLPSAQRACFDMLWPALKPGGLYFIEDCNPFPHHYNNADHVPFGDIMRPWSKLPGFEVWANFMDGYGNYRDDDILVMLRKP